MATTIRPELSRRNPYWIEKQRYYELKHFCLQYRNWKKEYALLLCLYSSRPNLAMLPGTGMHSDPTAKTAIARASYETKINMVERAASMTDPVLGRYILKGVTEGLSYEVLKARYGLPCCKDVYYNLYRKFFWILNEERG